MPDCRFAHSRRELRWQAGQPGQLQQSKLVGDVPQRTPAFAEVRRDDPRDKAEALGLPGMAPVIKSIEAILFEAMCEAERQQHRNHIGREALDTCP